MTNWQFPPQLHISPDLLDFTGDPLLAQLLVQRGLTTVEQARGFLDPEAYRPASPYELPAMAQAVARLREAIDRQERICIWGDFDVDGQTSTALLVSALQNLGAEVTSYIPDRLTESHGIKLPALQRVLADGVEVIVTCDTGIDAHEAVEAARVAGVEMIVTDHHDLPETLPPAWAVINPKRLPPDHSLSELPGVGVAYKLAEALYESYGRAADCESLLDLVALGIVADVARQTGDTRYLLQRGLKVLQQTNRPGLLELIENSRLRAGRLTEEHVGYWLAPRLNALGRLGDANLGVELLTTTDRARTRIIALQLEALNDRRRLLADRVVIQALGQIEDTPTLVEGYNVIVLAAAEWHPGVLGLAASRLIEQYGKPAILITLRPDGVGIGSARSVPGCDIHQALKSQAHLLVKFGGHPMAAGVTIAPDNVAEFRRGLSAAMGDCRVAPEKTVTIDALVDLTQVSTGLSATLQRLAPFGAGNPPVILGCRGLRILEETVFGHTKAHKRLVIEDEGGCLQEAVWWGGAAERSPQGRFDLAFTLNFDRTLQLVWADAQEWEPPVVVSTTEFSDWRQVALSNIQSLISNHPASLIWSEGIIPANLPARPRHQLAPAERLVIWSAPPGPDILQQVVHTVRPQQIMLVGQPSPLDAFPAFINHLLGLIKHALAHKEGEIDLEELAAALGHQVTTARLGIDWLAAQGRLSIYVEEAELLVLRPTQKPPEPETATVEAMLKANLTETAAFRRFFREASLGTVKQMIFPGGKTSLKARQKFL